MTLSTKQSMDVPTEKHGNNGTDGAEVARRKTRKRVGHEQEEEMCMRVSTFFMARGRRKFFSHKHERENAVPRERVAIQRSAPMQ